MATQALPAVVENLRRAMLRQDGAGLTDGELLDCFVNRRDEAAFEALVRRHGPMVLGVCRRVLRNEADAEGAFQATFLVLVRKAASVRPRSMVGNWLYGVAHNTALKARAMAAKQRMKEREAAALSKADAPGVASQELHDWLDQELNALPDRYRAPIVLCDLEGKSIKEAAGQLGCLPATLGTRLARGRKLLARRLARHGLALSSAAIAAALAENVASAGVPPMLLNATLKAAALFAAGQAASGVIAARVLLLAEGVVKAMFLTRLRTAVAVVLGLGLLAVATSGITYHVFAAPPANAATPAQRPAAEKAKTDLKKLQGSWVLVTGEMNGQKAPEGYAGNFRAVFTDNKLAFRTKDDKPVPRFEREWTVKLDPTAKPKAMDLRSGDQLATAIYELDGETLKICGGDTGGKRPTGFKGGERLLFLVLKREAAAKDGKK
jgi:RNA polymerase sigma-70 factor (ECF subfamily)